MRIIRVSSCRECPFKGITTNITYINKETVRYYCTIGNDMGITEHIKNNTLPEDKCPLEKVSKSSFKLLKGEEDIYKTGVMIELTNQEKSGG